MAAKLGNPVGCRRQALLLSTRCSMNANLLFLLSPHAFLDSERGNQRFFTSPLSLASHVSGKTHCFFHGNTILTALAASKGRPLFCLTFSHRHLHLSLELHPGP